jgi:hypothetical protein
MDRMVIHGQQRKKRKGLVARLIGTRRNSRYRHLSLAMEEKGGHRDCATRISVDAPNASDFQEPARPTSRSFVATVSALAACLGWEKSMAVRC